MQTRKLGLRALTLAMAGVLTLGLAACEETKTVAPLQPSVLTISPTGNVDLFVGDRIQIVANLQNPGANAGVAFASSNTAVATVDANGTVTAVAPGISTITATATGNAGETLRAAMTVRVVARDTTPPTPPADTTGARAEVVIQQVLDVGEGDEDIPGLQGVIEVVIDVTPNGADSLQVLVGNEVACRQVFNAPSTSGISASAAAAQALFRCPINTAELRADNTPRFPQGETNIVARVFDNGAVVASAQQQVVVANAATASGSISAAQTVIGPDGLTWNDSSVTVTVTPAVFSTSTTISRVTVTAIERDSDLEGGERVVATRTDTTAADGFSVTFPECTSPATGSLCAGGRVTTDELVFRVTTVTTAGAEGPSATIGSIRYDNVAPTIAEISLPQDLQDNFVGANFRFSASSSTSATAQKTATARGVTDPELAQGDAVGGVTTTFFFVKSTSANRALLADEEFEQLVAAGTQVDSANAIPASTSSTDRFIIIARAMDALGNATFEALPEPVFVDLQAPELAIEEDFDTIYGIGEAVPASLPVEISDDFSGFGDAPFIVTVERITALGETCVVGDEAENENLDSDEVCEGASVEQGGIVVPEANGYYRYRVSARDRAGNVSSVEQLLVLVDMERPVGGNVSASPITLSPGRPAEFSAQLADNLDIDFGTIFLFYRNSDGSQGRSIPVSGQTSEVGSFGLPLTRTATIEATTDDLVTAVYRTEDGTGNVLRGDPLNLRSVFSTVFDVAGNGAFGNGQFLANRISGDTPALNESIETFNLAGDEVCRGENCGDVDESVTLTVTVTGENFPTGGPFTQVLFYTDDLPNGVQFLLGADRSATITSDGNLRYTLRFQPSDLPLDNEELDAREGVNIRVVGVQTNGAAVVDEAFIRFVGSTED